MHGTDAPPRAEPYPAQGVSGAKAKKLCCIETLTLSNPVCPGPSCLPAFASTGPSPGMLRPVIFMDLSLDSILEGHLLQEHLPSTSRQNSYLPSPASPFSQPL